MAEVFFPPENTHLCLLCVSASAGPQGGSHSCNIFGRISCFLATQMSRKDKVLAISERSGYVFFPSSAPAGACLDSRAKNMQ